MEKLLWEERYSVNIDEIDRQHKKMLFIINEINDNLNAKTDLVPIEKILDDLVNYSVYHFSFEESLFAKHKYPDSKGHMKMHTVYIEQIKEYILKYERDQITRELEYEINNFLYKWLINHIMLEDQRYSEFLNIHGVV